MPIKEHTISFSLIIHIVKKLILMNVLFLALMSLFRVGFFFYFADASGFKGLYGYLIQAFILGSRFDLSAVAYINIPVTLSLLTVWASARESIFARWAKILAYYYTLMYIVAFAILVVDFGFYSYFKSHINVLIYGFFEDDTLALVTTIVQNPRFSPALAAVIGLVLLIYAISFRTSGYLLRHERPASRLFPGWTKAAFIFLLVTMNALAARGSLRMFPLSPIYAEISPNAFINKLSLNGIFALGETIKARGENKKGDFNLQQQFGYDGHITQAFADFTGVPIERLNRNDLLANLARRTPANALLETMKPNVVVIVMESFGANLLRYDAPEFDLMGDLRRHFASDYVFPNFLPAGLITIHALESIILNVPQRPYNLSVTQSKYAFVPFPTRATLPFKHAGYRTAFLYGGSLGWRQLASFLPVQGFDEVLGEGYMAKTAEKNEWGVYDEYLFDALYRNLSEERDKPKFILVMTTGNHPPYSVPASYKPRGMRIPDSLASVMTNDRALAMKRFTTYQYANQKLGEFITKVKNSPLGQNTIIAVTGDHNFWDVFNYGSGDLFYRYAVPFYLYVPDGLKPKSIDTGVFASHMDIMPTLYHLSLSDQEYTAMGRDLLEPEEERTGLNSEGLAVSRHGAVYHRFDSGRDEYYRWDGTNGRRLAATPADSDLGRLARYYKAAAVVAEYIIKNAGSATAGNTRIR
jgi:phosphoglycerol transferase MdoB-like AlkP superfamily enzyme